jgi:hypothetical protein
MDDAMTNIKKKNIKNPKNKKNKNEKIFLKKEEKKPKNDENIEKNEEDGYQKYISFYNASKHLKNCNQKNLEESIDDFIRKFSYMKDKDLEKSPTIFLIENIKVFSRLKNEIPSNMVLEFLQQKTYNMLSVGEALKQFLENDTYGKKRKIILKKSKDFLKRREAIAVSFINFNSENKEI